jgi:hypothetical protein
LFLFCILLDCKELTEKLFQRLAVKLASQLEKKFKRCYNECMKKNTRERVFFGLFVFNFILVLYHFADIIASV